MLDKTSGTCYWDQLQDENSSAAQNAWDAEWRSMVLKKCLDRIRSECGEKTFQAFELYAVSELPVEQVAEKMGISKNAVYIAKNRVLSRLRQLEHEFDDLCEGSLG